MVGALIAVLFIKEVPLRTSILRDDELAPQVTTEVAMNARSDDVPPARPPRQLWPDASADGTARLAEVSRARSDRFAEKLSSWSEADLSAFAGQLADDNAALTDD